MIVQMSEYSLMGKYSLIGCLTLMLYGIIDRRYVLIYSDGQFILYVNLFTLIYIKYHQE